MVSTGTYYLSHQLKLDIHPMNHLLRVEGVGGQMLQYLGYVVFRVRLLDFDQEVDARFLVVPDIGYNCDTPVVIGTSILQHIHSLESAQAPVPLRLFSNVMTLHWHNMNVSKMSTLLKLRPTNASDIVLTFFPGQPMYPNISFDETVFTHIAAVGNNHLVRCDVTGRSRQVSTSMFFGCLILIFEKKP